MFDQIASRTLEYQHWGFNALTVSFLLSLVLTIISAWGLGQQNRTIWRDKNAEAVSIFWLSYYAMLQLVILIYGVSMQSAALIFHGLLILLYVPILLGLGKFKGFTTLEKVSVAVFATTIILMALLPYKSVFFLALALGGLVAAAMQPLEMWRKKSAQGLNIKLIGTIILGTIIWFAYGLAVADWVVAFVNAAAFCIFGTTILLWRKFRQR